MKLLLGFWEGKCSSVAELQDNIALVEGFEKNLGWQAAVMGCAGKFGSSTKRSGQECTFHQKSGLKEISKIEEGEGKGQWPFSHHKYLSAQFYVRKCHASCNSGPAAIVAKRN